MQAVQKLAEPGCGALEARDCGEMMASKARMTCRNVSVPRYRGTTEPEIISLARIGGLQALLYLTSH